MRFVHVVDHTIGRGSDRFPEVAGVPGRTMSDAAVDLSVLLRFRVA